MGERKSDTIDPAVHVESWKYRAANTVTELLSWPKIRLNRKFAHLALVMSVGLAAVGIARADEKGETLPQTGPVPTLVENGPATDSPIQQSNEAEQPGKIEREQTAEKEVTTFYLSEEEAELAADSKVTLNREVNGEVVQLLAIDGATIKSFDVFQLSPTTHRIALVCQSSFVSETIYDPSDSTRTPLETCSGFPELIVFDVTVENGQKTYTSTKFEGQILFAEFNERGDLSFATKLPANSDYEEAFAMAWITPAKIEALRIPVERSRYLLPIDPNSGFELPVGTENFRRFYSNDEMTGIETTGGLPKPTFGTEMPTLTLDEVSGLNDGRYIYAKPNLKSGPNTPKSIAFVRTLETSHNDAQAGQADEALQNTVEQEQSSEKLVTSYYLTSGINRDDYKNSYENITILMEQKDGVESPLIRMNGGQRVDYDVVHLSPTHQRIVLTCGNEGGPNVPDNSIQGISDGNQVFLGECIDIMPGDGTLTVIDITVNAEGKKEFKSLQYLAPKMFSISNPRLGSDGKVWYLAPLHYNRLDDANGFNDYDNDGSPDSPDRSIENGKILAYIDTANIDAKMAEMQPNTVQTIEPNLYIQRGSSHTLANLSAGKLKQVFVNSAVFSTIDVSQDDEFALFDYSTSDVEGFYMDGENPVPIYSPEYGRYDEETWLNDFVAARGVADGEDVSKLPPNKYLGLQDRLIVTPNGEEFQLAGFATSKKVYIVENNPEALQGQATSTPESLITPEQDSRVVTKYYLEQKENGTAHPDIIVIQEINGVKDEVIKLPLARNVDFSVYQKDGETFVAVNCQGALLQEQPVQTNFTDESVEIECSATPQTTIIRFDISGNREVITFDSSLGHPTFDPANGDLYLTAENTYYNSATGETVKDPFNVNVYGIKKEKIDEQFSSLNDGQIRTIQESRSTTPLELHPSLDMSVVTTFTRPDFSKHVTFDATTGQFTFPANGGEYPDFVGELTVKDGVPGFIPSDEINDQFWQAKAAEAKGAEQKLLEENNGIMPVGEFTSVQPIENVGTGNDPEVFMNVVEAAG